MSSSRKKDQGYAWVIVILAFICHTVVWGLMWTIGIWTTKFETVFGQSKTYTSFVGSGINATNYVAGLFGSFLCKHYGHRRVIMAGSLIGTLGFCLSSLATSIEYLFATFSLMIGCGLGITFIPAVDIVNEYFDIKKTIAFGLSLSGVGCGMLVYPSINNFLISQLGWRYALVANSGFMLSMFVCGFLMRPLKEESLSPLQEIQAVSEEGLTFVDQQSDLNSESSCCTEELNLRTRTHNDHLNVFAKIYQSTRIFKSVPFTLFCINNVLFFASMTILWVHLNGYIIKSGLGNSTQAGLIYSIIGMSNVFGRIFLGIFCDLKRVNPIVVYTIGNFFLALNELYASFAQTYSAVILSNVIFGFISAVGGPLLPSIIIEFLGEENLAIGYGFLLIFEGLGSFVGPPLAGMLYNLTESYDCAFYLAASLFLIAGAVMSLPVLKFHKPNKNGSNYAPTSDIEVYSRSTSSIETQTFVEDLVED